MKFSGLSFESVLLLSGGEGEDEEASDFCGDEQRGLFGDFAGHDEGGCDIDGSARGGKGAVEGVSAVCIGHPGCWITC